MNILATLVYLKKDDNILLIRHGSNKHELYQNKWNGLGGKFGPEESPEECARREVFEESGLKVKRLKLSGIITFPKVDNENDWYVFIYCSNEFDGTLKTSKEGWLKWHKTKDVFDLNLWEGDYIFLPWVLEGKFFSAKFIYDKGKLISHEENFY